jgi:hypothetical protein
VSRLSLCLGRCLGVVGSAWALVLEGGISNHRAHLFLTGLADVPLPRAQRLHLCLPNVLLEIVVQEHFVCSMVQKNLSCTGSVA